MSHLCTVFSAVVTATCTIITILNTISWAFKCKSAQEINVGGKLCNGGTCTVLHENVLTQD